MPVSTLAVVSVLSAVVLAVGLSAVAARTFARREFAPWWGALAVGLADLIAHLGVLTPSFPPSDVTDRIPIVTLAATIVAVVLAGRRGVFWARLVGLLGLAVLVDLVMLGPILGAGDLPRETIVQLSVVAAASALALGNVALLDSPGRRSELWASLTVLAFGGGAILLLAHSAVLFQLGGLLGLMLAVSYLGAWGRPVGGGVPVASAVLAALVIEGAVYASLPTVPALILAAAPVGLWPLRIPFLARLGPKVRVALAVVLTAIPLAVALGWMLATASTDGY